MKQRLLKIEISHRTIIFTVLFLLGLYFVYLVRDVILLLFLALLLMAAVNPLVTKLETLKISRGISTGIVFLIVFSLLIGAIAAIIPPLINQSINLISQIPVPPTLAENIKNLNINFQDLEVIANQINSVPKVLNVIFSAVTALIIIITISVIAAYLTLERRYLHKHLSWLFGNNQAEKRAEKFINKLEEQIGGWVTGELTLMVIVGLMTFIGLKLLNINFALPLAIIAGLLEIIPNVGPTIAAIPAIIVAYLSFSTPMALAVTALYILIQQLENNFIVPMVMRKAVGLNSIATIVFLLIGYRLGGIAGAALAIPIFLVVRVAVQEFAQNVLEKESTG